MRLPSPARKEFKWEQVGDLAVKGLEKNQGKEFTWDLHSDISELTAQQ